MVTSNQQEIVYLEVCAEVVLVNFMEVVDKVTVGERGEWIIYHNDIERVGMVLQILRDCKR